MQTRKKTSGSTTQAENKDANPEQLKPNKVKSEPRNNPSKSLFISADHFLQKRHLVERWVPVASQESWHSRRRQPRMPTLLSKLAPKNPRVLLKSLYHRRKTLNQLLVVSPHQSKLRNPNRPPKSPRRRSLRFKIILESSKIKLVQQPKTQW